MKVFHHSLHKRMWDYISTHPGTSKLDSLEIFTQEEIEKLGKYLNPACEYVGNSDCGKCPFNVDGKYWQLMECMNGLYGKWLSEEDQTKRMQLAAKISDLPIRDSIKTD